jgi:NTP-dependent ternary system trypsin peptidase co-occuring protein
MTDDDANPGWVGLTEAIEALRASLVAAWWDGQQRRVRFKVEPVELTMQVGLTRVGKGAAGIRWHVLTLGGERSREAVNTQTLRLRLAPVLFDEQGNVLAEAEQLISDRDDQAAAGSRDEPAHERE